MHTMNEIRRPLATLLAALALAGCAGELSPEAAELDETAAAPQASQAAAVTLTPSREIEQALRQIERNRELPAARAALEAALAHPETTVDERDDARLGLAQALEALGEHEGAIAAVERVLAGHADGQSFPARDAAELRLRRLLTGSDAKPLRVNRYEDEPVAPVARVLARHFSPQPDGKVEIAIQTFGGYPGAGALVERLGTHNLGTAMREQKRDACPLCDDDLSVHTSRSAHGSWVAIPAAREKLGSAVTIVYFDLGENRVPARYDEVLAMPSAEIIERLEKGEGLVAVRNRPGAPPTVVLAAPRWGQLAAVEEAFAAMVELPSQPVTVALAAPLQHGEIRAGFRSSRAAQKACYKELLTRKPDAEGKVVLAFTIRGDGSVTGASVASESTLTDAALGECMLGALRAVTFPASGEETTVRYPVAMSPGAR